MDFADLRAQVQLWIEGDPDPTARDELRALLTQPDLAKTDLADRFAGSIEFGTAGLRGVIGAGPNRMNRAVIARATWGLAQELLASVPRAAERGVVVGGDARRMSRELSEDTAAILAASGLRVILFSVPVPTPLVAFTAKRLGAAGAVVVTASHNPPEYNGYKVYWENAAQIIPPVDARIAAAIARAPLACEVKRPPLETLRVAGLVTNAPADAESSYLQAVRSLAVHPTEGRRDLRIVYTPLHGVGDALTRRALVEAGFPNVTSVPEQQKPDGEFPTVAFPNPEEPGAMDLALSLAKEQKAELILANDPDVDRLAVAVQSSDSGYRQLTGNEVGLLLGHYLLTERAPSAAPKGRVVLASIVSSPQLGRIAADLGVRYEETLTGFKWIANRSMALEAEGYEVVFGFEEALGYCVGTTVRDKDGISAAVLAAEIAAVLGARGEAGAEETIETELDRIARRWGCYASAQVSVTRKGAAGLAEIGKVMNALRAAPPRRVAEDDVVCVSDYLTGVRTVLRTGETTRLALPKSNVLTLDLASGSRIIARPSGTEPKAKFYFDVRQDVSPGEPVAAARTRALDVIERLKAAFAS